jgi:uncharacterized protein YegL
MKTQIIKKVVDDVASWIDDAEVVSEENADNELAFRPELPINFEQKCPVVLVCDVSSSMHGSPIRELNKGLQEFQTQIKNDHIASQRLDCCVISFASGVKIEQNFALIDQFRMPSLHTSGTTQMVSAVFKGIEQVVNHKKWYKDTGQTYYRPFIILLTDGYPDRDQNVEALRQAIQKGYYGRHFLFWAFGVEGADMNLLKSLGHEGSIIQKIKGVEFVKFFRWLSNSMEAFSRSKPDEVPDITPRNEKENPFQITLPS